MPAEPSDSLVEFATLALDHAAASIEGGGPLVPFAMIDAGGERNLHRFPGDLEQGQAAARRTVHDTSGVSLAAVAWDGYLTLDGDRSDAVFVEASEAGADASVVVAQRYRVTGRLRKRGERLGPPTYLGSGEPLF